MKPLIITTLSLSALALMTQIPQLFSFSMLMIFMTMFFFMRILFTENTIPPVERSESGQDLTHVPYPVTDENMFEAIRAAENIYGHPRTITGSIVFQEQPLKVPVVLEGQPLVGALVEVELEDVEQPTDYFLMTEDGKTISVDRETFLQVIQEMYPDENGTKQYIPVLTGREDSIMWGLLGDAQASNAAAKRLVKKPSRHVPALRAAIADAEELLAFLALQNMSAQRD